MCVVMTRQRTRTYSVIPVNNNNVTVSNPATHCHSQVCSTELATQNNHKPDDKFFQIRTNN